MYKRQIFAVAVGVVCLFAGVLAVRLAWFPMPEMGEVDSPGETTPPVKSGRLSGPFTYKNLTIFLVHGETTYTGKTPLTLDEALKSGRAVVHETADVNELAIENISKTDEIFVQAGDIVKGGQQDRVLAVDLIVPTASGRMPIDAFCVEHGRWTPRLNESPVVFESAPDMVASKELKIAAKHSRSQSQVWTRVEDQQEKLSAATNANVQSNTSRSSMQLTLENPHVRADSGEYIKALRAIIDNSDDVTGLVFAINGKINSSDVYTSTELFTKLWPRLLRAAAIEAVSESDVDESGTSVGFDSVSRFLSDAAAAPVSDRRSVTERIGILTYENGSTVLIETLDRKQNGNWVHRNYLMR